MAVRLPQIHSTLTCALILSCIVASRAQSQQPETPVTSQPQRTTLPSGIGRVAGTDQPSAIQYTRLILSGSLHSAGKAASDPPPPNPLPILVAQCSMRPGQKYFFEMFANFGGPADLRFYPPWRPKDSHDLFQPANAKVTITMDFLGYTHVKPFRRQWEIKIVQSRRFRLFRPLSPLAAHAPAHARRSCRRLPDHTAARRNPHRAAVPRCRPLIRNLHARPRIHSRAISAASA
jgi:hypothetical protein